MDRFDLPLLLIVCLLGSACNPRPANPDCGDNCTTSIPSSSTAEETASSADLTGGPSGSGSGSETAVTSSETAVASNDTTAADTASFVQPMDLGRSEFCDVYAQDCPAGEKCIVCAKDNKATWGCSPIVSQGAAAGEPCTVSECEDNCDRASMCFFADADGHGICVNFCTGLPDSPECPKMGSVCLPMGDGIYADCSLPCDPLAPACGGDTACIWYQNTFTCRPAGNVGLDQPCQPSAYECADELLCVDSSQGKDCPGTGCCTTPCDASDPQGASVCPHADEGQVCQPFMPNGEPIPGAEHIGACVWP